MIQKNIIYLMLLSVIGFTSQQCVSEKNGFVVKDLLCEYLNNPRGIDIVKPNLGWINETSDNDDLKNVKQVAYRILVASSPE